jgi:hypothetical protein
MKICTCCKQELDENQFYPKKNGKTNAHCKTCSKKKSLEWARKNRDKRHITQAKYKEANREKIREKNRIYSQNNKEKISERQLKYRLREPERVKATKDKYRLANKEKCNAATRRCAKVRLAKSPKHKMIKCLRDRVYHALKNGKGVKSKTTLQLLGCTVDQCKEYLTSLFQEGMTWENYGKYTWNIDHIIPCDHFNLLDEKEQEKCFHYTNLQPLWFKENNSKNNKLPEDFKRRKWNKKLGWVVKLP